MGACPYTLVKTRRTHTTKSDLHGTLQLTDWVHMPVSGNDIRQSHCDNNRDSGGAQVPDVPVGWGWAQAFVYFLPIPR